MNIKKHYDLAAKVWKQKKNNPSHYFWKVAEQKEV